MPKRLPKDLEPFIQGLYRPDFDPEELKVAEALRLDEDDLKIVEDQNDIINIKINGNIPNKTNHNTPGANKNKGLPIGPLRATNFFLFLYIFLSS